MPKAGCVVEGREVVAGIHIAAPFPREGRVPVVHTDGEGSAHFVGKLA